MTEVTHEKAGRVAAEAGAAGLPLPRRAPGAAACPGCPLVVPPGTGLPRRQAPRLGLLGGKKGNHLNCKQNTKKLLAACPKGL